MSFNKVRFQKGLKYLAMAMPFVFLGPVITTIGFRALHDGIYLWIVIGIVLTVIAFVLGFLGLKNITASFFD